VLFVCLSVIFMYREEKGGEGRGRDERGAEEKMCYLFAFL